MFTRNASRRDYDGEANMHCQHAASNLLVLGLPARLARWMMGIFLVLVLVADVLVFPMEGFAWKREEFVLSNGVLLLGGAATVFALLMVMTSNTGRTLVLRLSKQQKMVDRGVIIVTLVLFVVQVAVVHSYVFAQGWDVGHLTKDGWQLAHRNGFNTQYYSHYPNNLLLLRLVQLCMKAAVALGTDQPIVGIYLFDILNCMACAVALLCIYYVLRQIASVGCALVGYALGVMLLWTSPWASIMYSDAIMLATPIAGIAMALAARRQTGWRSALLWSLFGATLFIGYRIKPQQVFLLFSVVMMGMLSTLYLTREDREQRKPHLKRLGMSACAVMLGVAVAMTAANVATSRLSSKLDENAQFGWPHYLMMGLNSEERGTYADEDVQYSIAFEDQASRTHGNLECVQARLQQMGIGGVAHLLLDKLLTNYADGTFAWAIEGHFVLEEPAWSGDLLSPLTLSLYYPGSKNIPLGSRYGSWMTYEQGVWLVVLLLGSFGLLMRMGSGASTDGDDRGRNGDCLFVETAAALTLLMLSAFELLFEARARYLYSFTTLYVLLAALGFWLLYRFVCTLRSARSEDK